MHSSVIVLNMKNSAQTYCCTYQSLISATPCVLESGTMDTAAVPHCCDGICTRSTETGVFAQDQCYDRTRFHSLWDEPWDEPWSRIGARYACVRGPSYSYFTSCIFQYYIFGPLFLARVDVSSFLMLNFMIVSSGVHSERPNECAKVKNENLTNNLQ